MKQIKKGKKSNPDSTAYVVGLLDVTENVLADIVKTQINELIFDSYPSIKAIICYSDREFGCMIIGDELKKFRELRDYCKSMTSRFYAVRTLINNVWLKDSVFRFDISVSLYPYTGLPDVVCTKHTMDMSLDFKLR